MKAALTKGLTVPAEAAADPDRLLKEMAVAGAPEPLSSTPRS